jgi:anti-sigma regulatory factor (Ser/Thr protein kinase)
MPLVIIDIANAPLAKVRSEIQKLGRVGLSPSDLEVATLLATELVANALKHGGVVEKVELEISLEQGLLRVGVCQPRPFARAERADNGLGLRLVEKLADRWGHELLANGTTKVWFELRSQP